MYLNREKRRAMIMCAGDFFKCKACGHVVRKLVRGNFAKCPICGSLMERI